MSIRPYSVVGYFAREHGLNGLAALLQSDRYEVACVFTHRRLPKSECPGRRDRPEFDRYQSLCRQYRCPLVSVDAKHEIPRITEVLKGMSFDLNASISWRFLIPPEHLALARMGGINLHRGKLPDYAGAEPIKRMLIDGFRYACISAHVLDEVIDAGETLQLVKHPMRRDERMSLDENVKRVKQELTPYFGPLLIETLHAMATRDERENG